tara:strand:- start:61199 stop:62071 length:873 start_codon:yes stop_codon:yes gene_type:complete
MAQITAAMVKELRERTGVGMMECKKALVATDGDIDVAIEEMRKSGMAKAAKKSGRTAAEGLVTIVQAGNKVAMTEINCETDFVALDENFVNFTKAVTDKVLADNITDVEALKTVVLDGATVEETRQTLVAKIGENMAVRRIAILDTDGAIGTYRHGDKIGVVVTLKGGDEALAKDIAMHVAASRPEVIKPEDMPAEKVAKEKEIFVAQAKESGKPDDIIEKMTTGRINKFLNENSLLGQAFVKDPDTTIANLLKKHNAEVEAFVRFEVGEGIEKEESNFADEVMAQVQAS